MRNEHKLALAKIADMRSPVQEVFGSVKHLLSRGPRRGERPLRDLDEWSDQAEVAYYEQQQGRRA